MNNALPKQEQQKLTTITLSKDEANRYAADLKRFELNYQSQQENFQSSDEKVYFIVSSAFLKQWINFCKSDELTRPMPQKINYDIVEKDPQTDNETKGQSFKLKKNLIEGQDFEIISEKLYELFAPFNKKCPINNRRIATVVGGREKRVPIYPPTFKYVICTYEILKAIDFNRKAVSEFPLKTIEMSEENTLKQFVSAILQQQEIRSQRYEYRIWQSAPNITTAQKLHKLIRDELKPCSLVNYKISGAGKRLDDTDSKLSDHQDLNETDKFFIIELKSEHENYVFLKDDEGRCENCNKFAKLETVCGCQKVRYCSEQCLQKDKHYHIRRCSYAQEQELNKKVEMVLTDKSRRGVVGLSNLGNTCFMNSCLQCLSNTKPLTEYFLKMYFESEINKVNPIGTKGKLAKNYAKFIKAMWCDQEDTFSPYGIKNAVSDINPMFSGYAQHDSQQFFSFLVDGLHEDLNRIEKKPYVESVEQGNKSQKQLALESWIAHLKRNQSIVTDLMTGQYRSIVTCPDCGFTSTTFDPFITITLPIPSSSESVTDFFFIRHGMHSKTQRAWFKYKKADAVEWVGNALKAVNMMDEMENNKAWLYVVTANELIYKVGRDSMTEIAHKIENESKNLFLIELSPQQQQLSKQNKTVEFISRVSKEGFYDTDNLFFKFPLFFDKTKPLTGLMIFKKYAKWLYGEAYDDSKHKKTFGWGGKSYEDYQEEMLSERPFKVVLRTGRKIERNYSRNDLKYEKEIIIEDGTDLLEILDKAEISIDQCELDARFEKHHKMYRNFSFERLKEFDTIGKEPKSSKSSQQDVEIEKCFKCFEEPEVLEAGNQWYCSKCKEHKLALKRLSIYRAPKILILHIKRFKQKGTFKKQKNETTVLSPMTLSMQPFLINPSPIQAYEQEIKEVAPEVLLPHKYTPEEGEKSTSSSLSKKESSKPIYNLYAIDNHFGSLTGGHYTACAKGENGKWISYNDSHVSKASEKDLINEGNYLLFYERQD